VRTTRAESRRSLFGATTTPNYHSVSVLAAGWNGLFPWGAPSATEIEVRALAHRSPRASGVCGPDSHTPHRDATSNADHHRDVRPRSSRAPFGCPTARPPHRTRRTEPVRLFISLKRRHQRGPRSCLFLDLTRRLFGQPLRSKAYRLGAFSITRGDVVRLGSSAFGSRLSSALRLLCFPELGFGLLTLFRMLLIRVGQSSSPLTGNGQPSFVATRVPPRLIH
jgi:hypothetical protein